MSASQAHPCSVLLARHARDTPQGIALVSTVGVLSWEELDTAASALAAHFARAGLHPGHLVSVDAVRSIGFVVSVLALWRAGAAIVFLDSSHPHEWRRRRLELVRPQWVLEGDDVPHAVLHPLGSTEGLSNPAQPLSHVMFTSGTTAPPIPVGTTVAALRVHMRDYRSAFPGGPRDRYALLSGLAHDPIIRDISGPLLSGGTLVVPPADVLSAPRRAGMFLGSAGISVLHCTPGTLTLMDPSRTGTRWDALRLIICGGAPLSTQLARQVVNGTHAALVNAYGVTELPQIASAYRVTSARLENMHGDVVPVGRGFGRRILHVEPGAVACEETRGKVLVKNPAPGILVGEASRGSSMRNDGAYATGDLGYVFEGRTVFVTGRCDNVLSVNGERISRQEVEAVVRQIEGVEDARLYIDDRGSLALDLALRDGVALQRVREQIARELPLAARPRSFTQRTRADLDPNMKRAGTTG